MHVAIYSRVLKEKDIPYVQEVFDNMHKMGMQPYVHGAYFTQIKDHIHFPSPTDVFEDYGDLLRQEIDSMITLGGDGTILDAVTLVRDSDIPMMGINLGRLGFLANIGKDQIAQAIESLVTNAYIIDRRTLLHIESNFPLFGAAPYALNDFTILKRDTSSMIVVSAYINGEFLNSYWADGLIVATPTGSTGYSLSCGGPIVFPNSGNFVITPVAPHNLNVRPIVIPDDSVVSFEIEGRSDSFLCTLDSRFEAITPKHQIAIRKEDFTINLVRLHDRNFMSTIRDKLSWGLDRRN